MSGAGEKTAGGFRLAEFRPEDGGAVLDFLAHCLPQSGRSYDPGGKHRIFLDIPRSFERFWCLFAGEDLIGTAAFRPLEGTRCELKGLYLEQRFHGQGLGARLLETAMDAARAAGYREMLLETLSTSERAIRLYRRAGFAFVPCYRENATGDVFMAVSLEQRIERTEKMKKILVINGPNLNMLGIREPAIYGAQTYQELCGVCERACAARGLECECFQSNHEGALVDRIQAAYSDGTDGIVINPAAYTHTSVAILDALKTVGLLAVEVHISDVKSREDFRQISYSRLACFKTVMGEGLHGYELAIEALCERLESADGSDT